MTRFVPKPIRKILVPVDFSDASERALQYAGSLAEICKASVVIVHVNDAPGMLVNDATIAIDFERLNKDIEASLKKMADRFSAQFKVEKVITHAPLGFTIQSIKEELDKETPDLVIMGTHGASGLKEFLIGTQTYRVIENCNCPVLVIPKDAVYKAPQKVVFATNFNDHELQPLFLMVELLRPFNPEIIVLHIDENRDRKLEKTMLDYFQGQVLTSIQYDNLRFVELNNHEKVEKAIEKFVEQNNIDWIGTAKRKRNFFDLLTSKSLTKELAFHTHIPLLAFQINVDSATPVF